MVDMDTEVNPPTSNSGDRLAPPTPRYFTLPSTGSPNPPGLTALEKESRPSTPTQGRRYNDKYVVVYDFGDLGAGYSLISAM
jgi:hypothetical protein